ncbi:transferase activity protein [[Candida] boidinii]|uniref:Unnamed protein product n=1 Tax=Candida boidinii TaxID=5477 RepID=A0ACB5THQ3_CANBO|nr:transferase activity protein [[Candida] boidinii]OWB74122.1 transferase activity protein [[Candida] boidinii]GME88419.1 unnamed protein product [[Candida] boidinii]
MVSIEASDIVDAVFSVLTVGPIYIYYNDMKDVIKDYVVDEIFHIPQAQEYCIGNFDHWNDKITTPPGLYYLAYIYNKLFTLAYGESDQQYQYCNMQNLRSLNFIGGLVLILLTLILRKNCRMSISTLSIYLSPLLSVYYLLFYTDIWSSVLIVASYLFAVIQPFNNGFIDASFSAFIGLLSLSFRQTNIVWLGFNTVAFIDQRVKNTKSYDGSGNIFTNITIFTKQLLQDLIILIPFILDLIIFVYLTIKNGGITYGDKTNHEVAFHLVQVFYCFSFITVLSIPIWISYQFIKDYLKFVFGDFKNTTTYMISLSVIVVIIENFTIIHKFLLADNRHLTFYLFKSVIHRSEYSSFYMAPIYHFSSYTIWKMLKKSSMNKNLNKTVNLKKSQDPRSITLGSPIISLMFLICILVTLIPSPLFEPRYFILPLIFFRILTNPNQEPLFGGTYVLSELNAPLRLVLDGIWNFMITQSIYIILSTYTFRWADQPGVEQRIIW